MERTLFGFIWRYSKRDQVLLLVMTGLSFPFLYVSLELPKTIINEAIGGENLPGDLFGIPVDQIQYLFVLSGLFLALVCVNGAFKYVINVFRGQLGERMLRRLRYLLYGRVLRFPLGRFRRTSQGEIIQMITAEVEPLGGFVGDSIALPAFQGGTLLTILIFMFVQDWMLGLAAISLYPIQAYMIPKLQRRVNELGKERVRTVRQLSERIGESISGIEEIHANDGARWALANVAERLGVIFGIRYEIYRRKFFIKFLNNFIAQLTPFLFYAIGGWLVIRGDLTFGALVAVLAAYKDLSAPWKELLGYYQRLADARIKYDQVVEQFDPAGTMPAELQFAEPPDDVSLVGPLVGSNVTLLDEDGEAEVESLTLTIEPGTKVALVGPGGGGRDSATMLLARLLFPDRGGLSIAGASLAELPESVTGRRIGYVGPAPHLFNASLRANILLGAMHRPVGPAHDHDTPAGQRRRAAAAASGNSTDETTADWVDMAAVGVGSDDELEARLAQLLGRVDLGEDVYGFGLRSVIDPDEWPGLADRVVGARRRLRERLREEGVAELVEAFDETAYNTNASVAENLLFGTPVGPAFALDHIAQHPHVRHVLDKTGLVDDFARIGRDVAVTMVELFADLPPDHEYFTQYSFISAEDLPIYQVLLGRAERLGLDGLDAEDRDRLVSLPFKLIPARHRLGMITPEIQDRILQARRVFTEDLPDGLRGAVAFFSSDRYNAAATLQDNILFGKVIHGRADAQAEVGRLLAEVIDGERLRDAVLGIGLGFEAGIAGARLTAAQRQKTALARALLRRPDILILNQATAALDPASQARVMTAVFAEVRHRTVVWSLHRSGLAPMFGRILVFSGNRVVEDGEYEQLMARGGVFASLIEEEKAGG